jgi:hypothetical protein
MMFTLSGPATLRLNRQANIINNFTDVWISLQLAQTDWDRTLTGLSGISVSFPKPMRSSGSDTSVLGQPSIALYVSIYGGVFQMRLSKDLRGSDVMATILMAILGIIIIAWPGVIPAQAQNNSGVIEGLIEDTNSGKLPNAVIIEPASDLRQ